MKKNSCVFYCYKVICVYKMSCRIVLYFYIKLTCFISEQRFHGEIVLVIWTLIRNFVKKSVFNSVNDMTKVDFRCRENQHDDDLLAVGMAACTYVAENEDVHTELRA